MGDVGLVGGERPCMEGGVFGREAVSPRPGQVASLGPGHLTGWTGHLTWAGTPRLGRDTSLGARLLRQSQAASLGPGHLARDRPPRQSQANSLGAGPPHQEPSRLAGGQATSSGARPPLRGPDHLAGAHMSKRSYSFRLTRFQPTGFTVSSL